MKAKVLKRFVALVMSTLLMLGASVSAFATEVPVNVSANPVETIDTIQDTVMSTRANIPDSGYCSANGELRLYPTLGNYIGFTRTLLFYATAIDSNVTPGGDIRVYVYGPDGNLVRYFETHANEDHEEKFTLPSAGEYKVVIYSEVDERLHCNAVWYA